MTNVSELYEMMAYKLRVMLHHIRNMFDACKDTEGHGLKGIFRVMEQAG